MCHSADLFAFCPSKFIWNTCKNIIAIIFSESSQRNMIFGHWNHLSLHSSWHHPQKVTFITVINPVNWWPVRERVCHWFCPLLKLRGELALAKSEWGNYLNHLGMNESFIQCSSYARPQPHSRSFISVALFLIICGCIYYIIRKTKSREAQQFYRRSF